MTRFHGWAAAVSAAAVAASWLPAHATASAPEELVRDKKFAVAIERAMKKVDRGTSRDLRGASLELDDLLADDTLSPTARSVALELRSSVQAALSPNDLSPAIADLREAIALETRGAAITQAMHESLLALLTHAEGPSAAVRHLQKHPEGWRSDPGGYYLTLARYAYFALDLATAEHALEQAETRLGMTADTVARRYAILLLSGRAAEARQALAAYGQAAPYMKAVESALAAHDGMVRRGATAQQFANHAKAIGEALTEELSQHSRTVERTPPRNFETCIKTAAVEQVKAAFDVTSEGRTEDIRIQGSTNPCYNRSAIESIETWIYEPIMVDGQPIGRQNVQATIRYQVGDW